MTMQTLAKNIGSDTKCSVNVTVSNRSGLARSVHGQALRCEDLSPQVIALFREKVQKTKSCWLWTGYIDANGYGMAYVGKRHGGGSKSWYAHRFAYVIAHGDVPAGAVVMHTCDNPTCVNPDHLRLGTQAENMREASEKGRMNSPRPTLRKISEEQVRTIRESNQSSSFFAKLHGVCVSHINRIRRGEKRKRG